VEFAPESDVQDVASRLHTSHRSSGKSVFRQQRSVFQSARLWISGGSLSAIVPNLRPWPSPSPARRYFHTTENFLTTKLHLASKVKAQFASRTHKDHVTVYLHCNCEANLSRSWCPVKHLSYGMLYRLRHNTYGPDYSVGNRGD
jgi:hypothetical protein